MIVRNLQNWNNEQEFFWYMSACPTIINTKKPNIHAPATKRHLPAARNVPGTAI